MCYNKLMNKKSNKGGFTMVELSLSIVFIAILSIAIVLLITNAVSAYHRGLTLNSINTTGMDIVDDITSAIKNVSTISESEEELKNSSVVRSEKAEVTIGRGENPETVSVPVYGAFCTGRYSYIWNSGYLFSGDYKVEGVEKAELEYHKVGEKNDSNTATDFKLLKVRDENRSICKNYAEKEDEKHIFSIAKTEEDPIDILENVEGGLALYDLDSTVASNGKNLFYDISFILGTINGGINVQSSGGSCATPEGFGHNIENFDYCAINEFNFAVQSAGK